jgi:hypothetical protein
MPSRKLIPVTRKHFVNYAILLKYVVKRDAFKCGKMMLNSSMPHKLGGCKHKDPARYELQPSSLICKLAKLYLQAQLH